MAFWGAEVKPGEALHVNLGTRYLRLRQIALGEIDGETLQESVTLSINVKGKDHVLKTFKARKRQLGLLWVLEKKFKISHTLKNGSLYLLGNTVKRPFPKEIYPEIYYCFTNQVYLVVLIWKFGVVDSLTKFACVITGFKTIEAFDKGEETPAPIDTSLAVCMDIATCYLRFEEGSATQSQVQKIFEKESVREIFMNLNTRKLRKSFLETWLEKEN